MRGMRGKLLKTLKSIPTISSFRHGLVFQLSPTEKISIRKNHSFSAELVVKEALKDEDKELGFNVGDNESVTPPFLDFEEETDEDENLPSLLDFEEKCPPGGGDSVILYSTSLTGIRKTFEDCKAIRFLLESFKVTVQERDVSMHMEFREELWKMFDSKVIPPRLFIKGRYIGGADEVVVLHEQGKLKKLLEGIPQDLSDSPCCGCANMRFVVCFNCNGSRKVFADSDHENDELHVKCAKCNENGLIRYVQVDESSSYLQIPNSK
ncbi:uncharacterized protein At5g39865-like isoform X2 [Rosa rugosa]|uniref:uncharacterized protein At5g39865-like isoform X2 n=2 Tax=Rosa rugosa TaxID=74645 RepID=UPI002B4137F8|nr:uncharacterized protein At5g39865-like isoform X2 [Rosa rugosa]